jgi:hypothetical protein
MKVVVKEKEKDMIRNYLGFEEVANKVNSIEVPAPVRKTRQERKKIN